MLLELQSAGFRVPDFFVSPSDLAETANSLGTPLAVRSSATVEDGRMVSFAGQFSSYLNLCSLEDVEAAVRKCRESVQAPSVVQYCRRNGVDPSSLQMEVIVQRMIQPELAGVAFTVNPVTGAEEVFVEACEGLADGLLAGRKTALPHDHPLLKRYLPRIEATARKIQQHFPRLRTSSSPSKMRRFSSSNPARSHASDCARHRRMDQRGLPRRRGIQRCLHSPDVVALRLHLGERVERIPA